MWPTVRVQLKNSETARVVEGLVDRRRAGACPGQRAHRRSRPVRQGTCEQAAEAEVTENEHRASDLRYHDAGDVGRTSASCARHSLVRPQYPFPRREGRARLPGRARRARHSCRPSRVRAAGKTARSRSSGRSLPATASRGSTPDDQLIVLKCPHVAAIVSVRRHAVAGPRGRDREPADAHRERAAVRSRVPFIKEGDKVQVVHGPLKGVVGRLVRKGRPRAVDSRPST